MGVDEEGTHERLKAHFRELVDPKIEEHRGRVVKNTGDGLLAEFASVVDAIRCAVEMQRGMTERNATLPTANRVEFRISVHQGDVVIEEHDIFGDAVNVAASVPDLATADIVDLMLNTKIPPHRIIDWIDQAILLTYLGVEKEARSSILRSRGTQKAACVGHCGIG